MATTLTYVSTDGEFNCSRTVVRRQARCRLLGLPVTPLGLGPRIILSPDDSE